MNSIKKCSAAIVSAMVLGVAPAHATLISSEIGNTGWALNYDNSQVSNPLFVQNPNASEINKGTLSINVLWVDKNPIPIWFTEDAPAATSNFGFRITLDETVTNNSGEAFNGFGFAFDDKTTPATVATNPEVSTFHPGTAHFHSDGGIDLADFSVSGFKEGTFSFSGTNAILSSGATSPQWTGIGIHEFEIAGEQRDFQLIETPVLAAPTVVPEPSAFALLAIGLLSLNMAGRRKKA